MLKDLNENLFTEKIYDMRGDAWRIDKNTIIEFWVTWCPHCQAMMPRYEKVSEDFPDVDCYRVEMEQHPSIAELFNIDGFPTFVFITPEGEMKKWVGEISYEELKEMVEEAFGE